MTPDQIKDDSISFLNAKNNSAAIIASLPYTDVGAAEVDFLKLATSIYALKSPLQAQKASVSPPPPQEPQYMPPEQTPPVGVEEPQGNLGNCNKCGAENKLSKAGKPYCAKVCWKPNN